MTDLDHDEQRSEEPIRLGLGDLLAVVLHVDDPRERLRRLRVVRAEVVELEALVRRMTATAIRQIRETDPLATWQEIGDLLGVSLQRAHELANPRD